PQRVLQARAAAQRHLPDDARLPVPLRPGVVLEHPGRDRLRAVPPLRAGAVAELELLHALRRMEGAARGAPAGRPRTGYRAADPGLGSAVGARGGAPRL